MPSFVTYQRVSTQQQGSSGLGLDAQSAAIAAHLATIPSAKVIGEFVEIESGKRADRPELAKAIALCRRKRATLLIAKLDRLARNVAFVSALMDSKVEFVCADNPHANKLTLHILAAVAEHEREMISARTKAALAAAKARGVKLGGTREGSERGIETIKARADVHAANVAPIIRDLQAKGCTTLQSLADALSVRGIRTPRGGTQWHMRQVSRVMSRA